MIQISRKLVVEKLCEFLENFEQIARISQKNILMKMFAKMNENFGFRLFVLLLELL